MRSKWAAKGQCSVSADGNKILKITILGCKTLSYQAKGQCSVSADGNKILIITIQAAKHYQLDNLMFCALNCDY